MAAVVPSKRGMGFKLAETAAQYVVSRSTSGPELEVVETAVGRLVQEKKNCHDHVLPHIRPSKRGVMFV